MTDLASTPGWDAVPQLETVTVAVAGPGGVMNSQAQALLNRTEQLKVRLDRSFDAHDYILAAGHTPGAVDADDQSGVQAAITAAAVVGGRVRVRKPIRNVWDLSLLTIPANVVIDDERYIDLGHTVCYATGGDVELRIHGTSVAGGEGPSFVAVNEAASGDRTTSVVGRSGSGAGSSVTAFIHFGWWSGSAWSKVMDFITEFSDGFRSSFRSLAGATIFNPGGTGKNLDPAAAVAAGYSLVVNRRADAGGGYQFGINDGAVEVPQELHVQGANAVIRLQNAAGANRFSILSDFPSAGQCQIYDHIAGTSLMTFTSGGALSLNMKGLTMLATASAGVPTSTLFCDSADGKLKFKDSSGTVNALY